MRSVSYSYYNVMMTMMMMMMLVTVVVITVLIVDKSNTVLSFVSFYHSPIEAHSAMLQ